MKKIVRLTEAQITRIFRRMLMEEETPSFVGVDLTKDYAEGSTPQKTDGTKPAPVTGGRRSGGSRRGGSTTSWTQAPTCDEMKTGTKEMKREMKDGCVTTVQDRLKQMGFTEVGISDGKFGTNTENAVKNLQGKNSLTQSGIVDKQTYEILFPTEKAKTIQDYVQGTSASSGYVDPSTGY